MNYTIKPITCSKPTIKINKNTAKQLGIQAKVKTILSYGKRKDETWIEIDHSIDNNNILIEQSIITKLLIDPDLTYLIKYINEQLVIGPVVGILIGKKEKYLKESLDQFTIYYLLEGDNNGCLFVFAEDQINFERGEITGFIYNKLKQEWQKSTFPFPVAIFRRIGINQDTYRKLIEIMGDKLFNSYFFDKWELWEWTSNNKDLVKFLPKTTNQVDIATLDEFIAQYEGVIIKPIDGSRGKGIYFITNDQGIYEVKDKYSEIKTFTAEELSLFLQEKKNYLVQQPIKLKRYQDRIVDYRVIVQKNEHNHWICTGMLGRFGKKDGVVSNYQRYGFARNGIESLQMQWDTKTKRAFQKEEEIINLAVSFANYLDNVCGPYVEFGMDIGIDENENIWLIEVNKRHDYSLFRSLENKKMYYDIKLQPINYAKVSAMKDYD